MNRFFRRIIAIILMVAFELGLVLMLRFGSPVFKILLIAVMVATVWGFLNYLKTDRKTNNKNNDYEEE